MLLKAISQQEIWPSAMHGKFMCFIETVKIQGK